MMTQLFRILNMCRTDVKSGCGSSLSHYFLRRMDKRKMHHVRREAVAKIYYGDVTVSFLKGRVCVETLVVTSEAFLFCEGVCFSGSATR